MGLKCPNRPLELHEGATISPKDGVLADACERILFYFLGKLDRCMLLQVAHLFTSIFEIVV